MLPSPCTLWLPLGYPQGHPALMSMGCSTGMQRPWGYRNRAWVGVGEDALEGVGALEGRVSHNEGSQLILMPER